MSAVKSYSAHLTERARLALKAAGIKGVTVRKDGSALSFTIREVGVSIAAVEKVAGSFESISRCEASGEILCGGNTFVDVDFGPKVAAHALTLWEPLIRACAASLPPVGENSGRKLDARIVVFRERSAGEWKMYADGHSWFSVWFGDTLNGIADAAASLYRRFGAPVPLPAE